MSIVNINAYVSHSGSVSAKDTRDGLRVMYRDIRDYQRLTRKINMMDDVKADVPRGAYMGIVPIRINNTVRVFFVPQNINF